MGVQHPDPALCPIFLSRPGSPLAKLLHPSPQRLPPLLAKLQLVQQIRHPNVASLLEVRKVEVDSQQKIYTEQQHPLTNLKLSMNRQTYLRNLQGLLRALRQYRLFKLKHGSISLASLRGHLDLKLLPPTHELDQIPDDFVGVTIAMVQIVDYDSLSCYYQGSPNWKRIDEGLKKVELRFGVEVKELVRFLTLKQDFEWLESEITKLIYEQPPECIRLNQKRAKSEQVRRNCIEVTCRFDRPKVPLITSFGSYSIKPKLLETLPSTTLAKTECQQPVAFDSAAVTPFWNEARAWPNLMHRTRQNRLKQKENVDNNRTCKAPPLKPLKILNHICRQTCPIVLRQNEPASKLLRPQESTVCNQGSFFKAQLDRRGVRKGESRSVERGQARGASQQW